MSLFTVTVIWFLHLSFEPAGLFSAVALAGRIAVKKPATDRLTLKQGETSRNSAPAKG
jgi:hypothetical protein